jgi:hypothetical protein
LTDPTPRRSPLTRLLLLAVLPALLVYVLIVWLSGRAGIGAIAVIRDLAQTCETPIGVGLLPSLGVLMWMAAAAIALFAAVAGVVAQRRWRRPLLLGGILSLLLTLDDFFLLHDRYIGPTFLYLLYAVLAIGILVGFRDLLLASRAASVFLVAAGFLGTSVVLDSFQEVLPFRYGQIQLVEEGAKFLGIASWLLFWWQAAAHAAKLRNAP